MPPSSSSKLNDHDCVSKERKSHATSDELTKEF